MQFWTLAFTANGPAPAWRLQQSLYPLTFFGDPMAVYEANVLGTPAVLNFANPLNISAWIPLNPATYLISVPLHATGLTSGATYHVVFGGVGGTAGVNDFGIEFADVGTTLNYSGNGGISWTAWPESGVGVPLWLYANGSPYPVGRPAHIIEDVTAGVPARSSWFNFDYWGNLIAIGEWTTATDANSGANGASWSNVTYNSDGTIAQVA